MRDVTFAIGEVAAMLGISPHTIRAWERRHLVVRPTRSASGQRRYTPDDVELLRQIKHERHVHGLSMRVATMTAQGLVAPDPGDGGPPGGRPPVPVEAGADPLRMVADLVSEVVVVVDAAGRIAHANTAFLRFCDAMLGQVRGLPFADVVDPFDRAKAVLTYRAPLRQRRDWELNLRTRRRRAFFSFDCWPVPAAEGAMLVLVGRDLGARPASLPPASVSAVQPAAEPGPTRTRPGMPAPLRLLLEGVADPVRTLRLLGRWLDATPFGAVLVRADADLTLVFANATFKRWMPDRLPLEGRPWPAAGPPADQERVAAAAMEAIRSAQPRTVSGRRPTADDAAGGDPVWDVDVYPVTDATGAVTHLLLVISDVTAESETARLLGALAASTQALRHAAGLRQLLTDAARHAQTLLPNAGSLVAAVSDRRREGVGVVAASGAWARADQGVEHRLRLTLVRDVIRTCASIEVQRAGSAEATETLRIVPLVPGGMAADRREAVGALAFSRLGATFSDADQLLIDEFAGRVGLALGRSQVLGAGGGELRLAI